MGLHGLLTVIALFYFILFYFYLLPGVHRPVVLQAASVGPVAGRFSLGVQVSDQRFSSKKSPPCGILNIAKWPLRGHITRFISLVGPNRTLALLHRFPVDLLNQNLLAYLNTRLL
jgi:hypothetical protein